MAARMPERVEQILQAVPRPNGNPTAAAAAIWVGDQRVPGLKAFAADLRQRNLPADIAESLVMNQNKNRCSPPLADGQVRAIARGIEPAVKPAPQGREPGPKPLETVDGWSLYQAKIAEPVPVVEGFLYRGVQLLCGRPKVRKSYMALDLAISVACGRPFLRKLKVCRPGGVLFLGLEEPPRRTAWRLRQLAGKDIRLQNIQFVYHLDPLMTGGAAQIDAYLKQNPVELVVLDTLLAALQSAGGGNRDVLRSDYREMNVLRELAQKHDTSILVIHHTRKMGGEGLDTVAGTSGVTAAADAVWTLKQGPAGDLILNGVGREHEERTYGLRFGNDPAAFGWELIGEGPEMAVSEQRQEILDFLREEGPHTPKQIAADLRKPGGTVRRLLKNLVTDGLVIRWDDRKYRLSNLSPPNDANERTKKGGNTA
jgi:hypothetical protein